MLAREMDEKTNKILDEDPNTELSHLCEDETWRNQLLSNRIPLRTREFTKVPLLDGGNRLRELQILW